MKVGIRFFYILILALVTQVALGQSIIKHFTVEDGLPSAEIYFVHQDDDGYIWFCTDRGVSRYNGVSFTNFTVSDGLTHNTVFKVFEDKRGLLWFTCMDGSITLYEKESQSFREFEGNEVLKLEIARLRWVKYVGFRNDSIFLFPYNLSLGRNLLAASVDSPYNFASQPYTQFLNDGKSRFDNGVLLNEKKYPIFPKFSILFTADFSGDLAHIKERINSIRRDMSIEVEVYQYGEDYFFCTNNGLFVLDTQDIYTPLLKNRWVTSMFLDKESLTWVTTLNDGVYILSDKAAQSKKIPIREIEKITSLSLFKNDVFVGTDRAKIYQLDEDLDIRETFTKNSKLTQRIKRLYNDGQNVLMYSDFGLRYEDGKYYQFNAAKEGQNDLFNWDRALYSPQFIDFLEEKNLYDIWSEDVYGDIQLEGHLIKGNSVYYATISRFCKLTKGDTNVKCLQVSNKNAKTKVSSIIGIQDFVIIGTGGDGIFWLKNDSTLGNFTTDDGLLSNLVNALYLDTASSRLLCATNKGLSVIRYEIKSQNIKFTKEGNLTTMDGLLSNYLVDIKKGADLFYLASVKGVSTLPVNFKMANDAAPSLILTGYMVEDSIYKGHHSFKYNQNNFQFLYEAVTNKKARYVYRNRLIKDGDTSNWNFTNEASLLLTNLANGSYAFEVCSKGANSGWSLPSAYTFTIHPSLVDRFWFRFILLFSALALFYYWFINRDKRIQNEAQLALAYKQLELQNVKLESSSLRGQMNPHFVFNVLNSIQKFILKEEKESANLLLSRFSKLVRASLKYSRFEFISLEDEIAFLTNYLNIESQRFPDRFTYSIKVDNEVKDAGIKVPPLIIQPLCENAVKHAFVNDGGELKLEISMKDDKTLIINVIDNGVGILHAKNDNDTSLGLSIIKDRLRLFKESGYECDLQFYPLSDETLEGTRAELLIPYK